VTRGAARGVAAAASTTPVPTRITPTGLRGGARRRRAQGHERSRRYEPPRAPPCTQAIPASQSSARQCVAATVHVHARPRRARSAQHPGNQGRGSKRGGDAPIRPCTRNPARRPVPNVLIARRRRRPRARSAQELLRRGTAVLRRDGQHSGKEQRRHVSTSRIQHRKETKGKERVEWARCSRWCDGVVVAGLSVAWRQCPGRRRRSRRCRCPRWCRCSRRRTYSAALVRAPAPGSRPLLLPVRRATRRAPPLARRRRAGVAASSLEPA
jgi:hypothetical protein